MHARFQNTQAFFRELTWQVYARQVDEAQAKVDRLDSRWRQASSAEELADLEDRLVKAEEVLRRALCKQNDLIEKRLRHGV
ncbi:MAG: hypothetical protein H6716_24805 [Polyangiaceae bacterium]|nr:hypothetical protein [Polyangiaceae bacterium]